LPQPLGKQSFDERLRRRKVDNIKIDMWRAGFENVMMELAQDNVQQCTFGINSVLLPQGS
jgi:hypothetical protein